MKVSLKSHLKLFEAIAMFLVLISWMLEWSSVKEWESLNTNLFEAYDSSQRAYTAKDLSAVIQLESAITRFIPDKNIGSVIPFRNYVDAWDSSEVRSKWFLQTENMMAALQFRIFILQDTEKKAKLKPNESLEHLDLELASISSELKSKLDPDFVRQGYLVPALNHMKWVESRAFHNRLGSMNDRISSVINETTSAIKVTADNRSFIYRSIFIVAALLLFFSKALEWYFELKSTKTVNNPSNPPSQ